jgi:hypothetical protein
MESPVAEATYPKNGPCGFALGASVWDFFSQIGKFVSFNLFFSFPFLIDVVLFASLVINWPSLLFFPGNHAAHVHEVASVVLQKSPQRFSYLNFYLFTLQFSFLAITCEKRLMYFMGKV